MKIYNRKDFLLLPAGTVFCDYRPQASRFNQERPGWFTPSGKEIQMFKKFPFEIPAYIFITIAVLTVAAITMAR